MFSQTESKAMLYESFWTGGFNITNNGYNLNFSRGSIPSAHSRSFWEIEFAVIHHPKEYKQTQDFGWQQANIPQPNPFVYGKQNSFFNLNFSYGKYNELGRRADHAGVSVGIKSVAGFSLGVLKPYYLNLLYPIDNVSAELKPESYSETNKNVFLDWNSIYGGAGFSYGLTELKIVPGAHAKVGMHFDYAVYDEYLKSIEAGLFFNAYYKKVPMMIIEKNEQFYPGLYVGFEFGKKW